MRKKRVLIITRNLPPLVGGMERLNWHMADELSKHAEVHVIGPSGSSILKPQNVKLSEAPLSPLSLFMLVTLIKTIWEALTFRPDIILAGSGLTAPVAWLASKLCGARSAAYLHGFDITVKNRIYQNFWVSKFKKLDQVIVNSTPTRDLALNTGVSKDKISIVHPGVTIPDKPQPAEKIAAFKQKHNLEHKKILLSVGRLTTRKGLAEFVEHALPEIVRQVPETVLVVVGEAPNYSLGAGIQSRESIERRAAALGLSDHLLFLGVITDPTQLAVVYEAADLHVFPVRHIPDDPEGFGMVAIEAAAHGLPTVAFATGGVVDAVKPDKSGHLAEKDNYHMLSNLIVSGLQHPIDSETTKSFSKRFSWENFGLAVTKAMS